MASITATVNPSGGANYTSLSAALTALAQDLTSVTCDIADEQGNNYIACDIVCEGSSVDSTAVAITTTWVTNATHRLRIRAASPSGAKWDTGNYRLVASPGTPYQGTVHIGMAVHVTLQDLQVESTAALSFGGTALSMANYAWNVRVIGGFYRTTSTTGTADTTGAIAWNATSSNFVLYMRNVTAVTNGSGAVAAFAVNYAQPGSTLVIYNCTFVNKNGTNDVFWSNGECTGTYKNNVFQGGGTTNFRITNHTPTTATNLTQDTTGTSGLQSKTLTFVDAINWDYHIASGDTNAKDVGTDLSGDGTWPFSNDGDGQTRSGAWDVGADEYVAAGGSPVGYNVKVDLSGNIQTRLGPNERNAFIFVPK